MAHVDGGINWLRAIGWCALAWVTLVLGMAVAGSVVRIPSLAVLFIAPLAVIFVAGVIEREWWWAPVSLLCFVPCLVLILLAILGVPIGDDLMMLVLVIALAPLSLVPVALFVLGAAALGVFVGQRREENRLS